MLKRLALIVGWLTAGFIGSVAIFTASVMAVGSSVPVQLPTLHVFTGMWDDYVDARGTWVMDNDRQASPLQTSEIACRRASMECTGAQADLLFGILNLYRETYQITHWDAAFLTFRNSTLCVEYVYTIDRANRRAIGTRTKSAKPGNSCDAVTPGPIQLSLTDGIVVTNRLSIEAWAKVSPFMWAALGVVWFFVLARIWRCIRGPKARPPIDTISSV
jgi:hypothetical protein